jgi:hypothetical protein
MKVYNLDEYCFVIDESEMMEISKKSKTDTIEFAENLGLYYYPDISATMLPAKKVIDNKIESKRIKGNAYLILLKKRPQLLSQAYKSEEELIDEVKQITDGTFPKDYDYISNIGYISGLMYER